MSKSRMFKILTRSFPPFSLLLCLLLIGCTTLKESVYQDKGYAIGGYDPVSYFTEHQAVKGKEPIAYKFMGSIWLFDSQQHRQMFIDHPQAYLPQYGGYCAYAMHYGLVVSSDPQAWTIIHDKLYLNYSDSVRQKWLKNAQYYIISANKEWSQKLNDSIEN